MSRGINMRSIANKSRKFFKKIINVLDNRLGTSLYMRALKLEEA